MNDFLRFVRFFSGGSSSMLLVITLDTSLPFGRPLSVRFAHQRLCSQKLRISCCFKATLRHSPIASLCLPLALQAIPLLHQLLPCETMDPNPTWDHGIGAGWDRYIRCSLENSWDSLEILVKKKPWLSFQESSPTDRGASLLNLTIDRHISRKALQQANNRHLQLLQQTFICLDQDHFPKW